MMRSLQISLLFFVMVVLNATQVFATPPTITPSGPSVAAVSATYGYPSSSVSFTFTASSLANGETVTIAAPAGFEVSLTAGSGYASSVTKNADGTGNISSTSIFVRLAAGTAVGSYSGNVTLNGTTASANVATTSSAVSAKALTMSGLSVPASKVYDGSTSAVVSGTAALLSSEALGSGTGADGKPITGDAVSITGTATGTYNSKDVASATTVTYGGLSLTGAQAGNYTLTIQSPASATITTKTLSLDGTLTASASRPYNGTTSASLAGSAVLFAPEAVGTGNTSDFKPYTGDVVSVTGTPVGTYNSKDVATATTITISGVSLTGAQATNYSLLIGSPSATITAKALTMSGLSVPASKIYDGTTAAVVSGAPALQSSEAAGTGTTADGKPYTGDVVSITGTATGTYNSKNVASATTVTYAGLSLTGADATNYSLTIQSPASATITTKALTMSGLTVPASKIYDATTAAVVSGTPTLQTSEAVGAGTTADGIPYTGDAVSITGTAAGTYNSKNVATATTVTFSGLSLTGAQATNYSLTIQGAASATITTKALTLTGATADNKTFDGTTAATISGSALQSAEAPGSGTTSDGIPYTGDVVSLSGSGTGTFSSTGPGTSISVTGAAGYSLTGGQATNYSVTQPSGLSGNIFSAKPTAQSTAMVFSSITNTTLTVSWTVPGAGGGNNRILVVKQGGAPTAPTNGTASTSPTTYTANAAFGSGSTTAAGSFVVYIGNSNTAAITGLTANTSYTFNLYEFNSAGSGTENYLTTSPLTQSQTTEDEPLNYPTGLTATATTAAGNPVITLNWTGSTGSPAPANYLVLARDVTNSGSFPAFSDGSSVPGNDNDLSSQGSTWNGSQVIAFGTNTYNGWTNNKLTAGNLYEFQINPYTTAGIINPDYKTTPAAPTVQVYTEPTASASNPTFSNITPTSIDVTVAGGTGLGAVGGYIVTRKVGSAPLTAPTDGTVYTTASTIGGDPVVYVGPATTFTDGSLTALTNYFYNVYVYSGTGALINYKTTSPGTANTTTLCTPPVTQATNVTFGTTTAGTMVINWTNGSGNNRIVIVNTSPITFVPSSGTSYTANTDFSSGTDLGAGQKCVFNGSGSTVTISGLSGATTYYVAVFDYNNTGTCYYKTSPASGTKATPSASSNSTFSAGAGGTLASTVTTQAGEAIVFTFTATDVGDDGVSTRFTQLIFRPGAGNQVADWTQLFGTTSHAELYDNASHGPAQHGTAIITANTITIPSISAGGTGPSPSDLGTIADGTTRNYTLKVWLLTSLGGTLPSTVDNKHVEFSITGSDATPVATKTQFSAGTTTSSGADPITVTATKININQQPSAAALAYVSLATQPIFEATDVNNNRDLDINNAITVTTTNPTDLGPNSAPTNFVNGLANFSASGFNFHNTGTSTMAVAITSPSLTSPNSSSITVTATTTLSNSVTSMSSSPLINNTTGLISGGTATNAVLGFRLSTSGSPLTLSQLVFNSTVSPTNLVQNFKLYSNSVDSYTGATQIATSSSLTFSGLSVALTSTPTYFFLVCDVDPYFPTASPTIQFSLPTSGVTVSAGSISGSTQTGINYLLNDNTPPVLQTITTLPGFLNSWATVWPYQMTTPAYNGNTADFLMTFSEPVLGMNIAKLTPQVSGLTSYALLSVSPATSLGGAASSPSQYWRISYAITGSNNSGTVNGGYVYSEYSNSIPYVTDVANNQETTSVPSRFIPAPPASDFYYVVLPKPTNPVNPVTLSAPTITTTSITLQWTQPAAPLGQIPTHYLVRAKESHLSFPSPVTNGQLMPDDPDASDGYVAINVANTGYPALSPSILSTSFSLNSGVSYDFEVYAYSKGSYPGAVEEIDYNSTPATITKTTLVANSAYITAVAATPTISSLITTQPLAHAQLTPNLKFQVTDEAFDQDNAPTKFSGVIVRQGTGNSGVLADWTQAIAGAELTDGTTVINASSITANQIIFTGISSTNPGDLGYVPDGTLPKTFSLNIWLKSSLGGTLPVSIDDKPFSFLVDQTSFTLDNISSNQLSSTFQISSYNTGAGANVVNVIASQLVYNVQPTTPIGVASPFPTAPVVYALDANSNRDLDYTNSATLSNTASLGQSINSQNFAAGVLTLSTFNFTTAGGPTQLTITGTGTPVVTPTTSTVPGGITTVISNLTKITAGAGAEPASFSSLTTAQSGAVLPQVNAALNFDFTITDDVGANSVTKADNDGLPTLFTALTITQDTNNGTNGGGDPLFDDWTNSIAGASLTDNLGNTITASSITATTINFTGISTATLGFIGDDGAKTYTLKIWLKNPVNASLSDIIDNKDYVFDIAQTNITINPVANTSSTFQASNTTSGDTNNKVNVAATQLDFTTQWAVNANQSYDAALSPSPIAKPHDANGNVDIDWSTAATVTTANPALYPPVNLTVTNNFIGGTRYYTFDPALQIASSGGGANGATTNLVLSSAGIPVAGNGISNAFRLNYSGNSDIVQDNTFTYPTNILYASANNQQIAPLAGGTGIALEQFLVRDGGAAHADSDGSPTILNSITLDVTNYQNLREIALFQGGSGGTNIKELSVVPANYTVISANVARFVFSGFTLTAPKNSSATLTVKASFIPTVTDNQVVSFAVNAISASATSSSQFANTTPSGIQSTVSGNQNKIEVVATKIAFTTVPASASLNVPFAVVVQAQDANSNLDADYNGTISSYNTSSGSFVTTNNPSGTFSGGQFGFPYTAGPPATGFQFTVGNGNTTLTLNSGAANTAGASVDAGAIAGTSPNINVITSFDSWLYFDPTFAYTTQIDFVPYQGSSTTNASFPLAKVILSDGGAPGSATNPIPPYLHNQALGSHDDTDGAATSISDFTISLTNYQDIQKIGLYTVGGVQIGTDQTPAATVTFSGINSYSAPDNDAITYVIRAEFKSAIVDQDQIIMKITNVTHNSGSDFPAATIGGVAGGDSTPSTMNFLDVIATSLDFLTQPSTYAGINEPIGINPATTQPYSYGSSPYLTSMPTTSAGIVTARDKFANVDLTFTPSSLSITDAANNPLGSPNIFSFSNGMMDLTGMTYHQVGNGAVKIVAQVTTPVSRTIDSSVPSGIGNSKPCNTVNVLNVSVTQSYAGVVPGSGSPLAASLKGGLQSQNIFGLTFTANSTAGVEPKLKGFTIGFKDKNGQNLAYENNGAFIFKNLNVFINGVANNITSTGGVLTKASSTNTLNVYDQIIVDLSAPSAQVSLSSGSASFYLVVDVDANTNTGTPAITPYFIDSGWGNADDQHTVVSNGTASGSFDGNQYSFASIKPPVLQADIKKYPTTLTSPYAGQPNVDKSISSITLQFDTNVGSLDAGGAGNAELWNRSTNTKVADMVLHSPQVKSSVDIHNTVSPIYPTLTFDLVNKPATLTADEVYFVKIIKGQYDPINNLGHGIADYGLNFFGGISDNSTLYFKISSAIPPALIDAKSTFNTTTLGTLTTKFDRAGTSYFIIVPSGSTPPTSGQVKSPGTYLAATVAASGNYPITVVSGYQTFTFPATFVAGNNYDVYIFAENDAVPSPVPAAGIYDGTFTAGGGAGPTLVLSGIAASQTSVTPNGGAGQLYTICPDSYVTITNPMVVGETGSVSFSSPSDQDFNVLLPTGFEYDVTVAPNIQLIGGNFQNLNSRLYPNSASHPMWEYKYISNTLLNIRFFNKNNPANTPDFISISGINIIGKSGGAQGNIQWFYGNNVFTPTATPYFTLAQIALVGNSAPDFNNSYWAQNKPFPSPNNPAVIQAFNKTVNTIPDNFVDSNNPGAIRLLPSSGFAQGDYLASYFSGSGVSGDLFTLNSVSTGTAFNISMTHTDLNGCTTVRNEQYLVYDHNSQISSKLGIATYATSPVSPAGTKQDIVNKNFPTGASGPIVSPTLSSTELAGYTLLRLSVDLPSSSLAASSIPLSGAAWRNVVHKTIIDSTNAPSYTWDYSKILNAKTPLPTGYSDVYDYYKNTTTSGSLNVYWSGGKLGTIQYTGAYQSTADNSVYVPFRQDVALFLPAVPLIEIVSPAPFYDKADAATTPNFNAVQYPVSNKTNGYPGTATFCEFGTGLITLTGFPLATAGNSTGVFDIFDYSAFDFSKVPSLNTSIKPVGPNSGFVDNGNGTATIDPTKINNGYKDILVTYTYQDNNSPAVGTGYLIIRISPNPVASFTQTSTKGTNAPNASALAAFCVNNQIDFDASASTINGSPIPGSGSTYNWNFGDANSPANTSALPNPSHVFGLSSTYTVTLDIVSNFGCHSKPSSSSTTVGVLSNNVKVGDIPTVDFSFLGNCVGSAITFQNGSKTPTSSNSSVARFDWDFGDSGTLTGYNLGIPSPSAPFNYPANPLDGTNVSHTYTAANSYKVTLTTTTDLGCQNSAFKYVGQLLAFSPTQGSAFTENFDGANGKPLNGGWITLDINPVNAAPIPVPSPLNGKSSWIYDAAKGNWTTTANYGQSEKSALYSACLNLGSVPRPVISFGSNVDLSIGEGLVLQYSVDNLNIQDPNKQWEVLGTTSTGKSPGLDWYNSTALPTNPGTGYTNSHNLSEFGWSGSLGAIKPRHKLDTLNGAGQVIFRFAFASANGGGKGITIDSIRVGSRTRTVLFENFTTTNAGTNTALNSSLLSEANFITNFTLANISSTQLVNINYHVGFLGEDPFNVVSPADPSARALFYNVKQVPFAFLDGAHKPEYGTGTDLFADWGKSYYDLQTLNLAKADFQDASHAVTSVTLDNTSGTVQVDVNVTPLTDLPATTVLQVGVLEESVSASQVSNKLITTGESTFNYVLKKLLPDGTGTKFPAGTFKNGVPVNLGSYKWIASPAFGANNKFSVVVFLQDEVTKDVYQADFIQGITPPTSTVTAIEPISAENIKVYPNPADQEFVIELPYAAKSPMSIQMANQLGQFTQLGSFSEGEQSKKVSTQGLADGVYILQLGSNGDALRTKVIVLHK